MIHEQPSGQEPSQPPKPSSLKLVFREVDHERTESSLESGEGTVITTHSVAQFGTMVSASNYESTSVRDSSSREDVVFFLMTLLNVERETASDASVKIHETTAFLEPAKPDSQPAVFQSTASIACDN
ncbi:MAG TPA: hypothetical protein VJL56_06870 [Candidatus Bathyarchaeia archaeon]|nr:hypothetical protein [Candidatus Bathyarchaeia archaeon]